MSMEHSEEYKKKIREHPCFYKGEDDCGACYNFPHPSLKCSVDGHTALQITGVLECLDWLYSECPKKGGD